MSKTTIQTSDGKEYDVENDCLIRKSEAIKQIYEKSLRIDNLDTRNGLAGAVAILSELKGENKESEIMDKQAGWNEYKDIKETLESLLDKGYTKEMIQTVLEQIEAEKKFETEVITRGNCMICGKELTEGLFFCKECENKANSRK